MFPQCSDQENWGLSPVCRFELGDGFELVGTDLEGTILPSELDKRTGDEGIVLDEDAKDSARSQEGTDLGNVRRDRPVLNNLHSGSVGDPAFVSTDVTKDFCFGDGDKSFLPAEGSAISFHTLHDSMDSIEMFPDKTSNTGVGGNSLVATVGKFVASGGTFDRNVVSEGLSPVRDLGTQNMSNVAL